jgi:hypothetical protein
MTTVLAPPDTPSAHCTSSDVSTSGSVGSFGRFVPTGFQNGRFIMSVRQHAVTL